MSELDDLIGKIRDSKLETERTEAAWTASGISRHDPPIRWPSQDCAKLIREFAQRVPPNSWEDFLTGVGPDRVERVRRYPQPLPRGRQKRKKIKGMRIEYARYPSSDSKTSDYVITVLVFEDGRWADDEFRPAGELAREVLLPKLASALA